jgi:hypothetical protein
MAVSHHVSPDDSRFLVEGWYNVKRGQCTDFGPFPKGWFYLYGEQRNRGKHWLHWSGSDLQLCVVYPGPFERVNTGGYTCDANELKGFSSFYVEDSTDTYTWNFNR